MGAGINLKAVALAAARHESGHLVVGRVLGFQTESISLTLTDLRGGHLGATTYTSATALTSVEQIVAFCRGRVVMLFSGVLAEFPDGGGVDHQKAVNCLSSNAADDFGKAREHLRLIRNVEHGWANDDEEIQAQLTALTDALWADATAAIVSERQVIEAIAARLALKVTSLSMRYDLSKEEIALIPEVIARFG